MPSPVRKEGSSSPQSGVRGVASAFRNYIAPPKTYRIYQESHPIQAIESTKTSLKSFCNIIKMSGFPSLQPAFTVRVDIDAPMQVGGQHGAQLVIVPMVSGTVKSEPGFEPKLDGELHGTGYDYIHNDADGGNMRLDVRSQVK